MLFISLDSFFDEIVSDLAKMPDDAVIRRDDLISAMRDYQQNIRQHHEDHVQQHLQNNP